MNSKPGIFISHSHSDWRLAERLQNLMEHVSGRGLELSRSSEKGAIKSGENWRSWIDDKVLRCDVAIVLLTPSSFRGRWVLWEAGAVAGVQYERLQNREVGSEDPLSRRVRVVRFNLRGLDLGPFASSQVRDGLDPVDMVNFVAELLEEFREKLDRAAFRKGMLSLEETVETFVAGAKEDLRYSPIESNEGMIQDWLARLDDARDKNNDRWIVAAKRWMNVAFLGANNADAHLKGDVIDFRIHTRIAAAHRRLGDWPGTVEQLQLAATVSPNDLVVLRELGRAQREMGKISDLEKTMKDMELLDPDIFRMDREGIAMRCGYFSKLQNWVAVEKLLEEADQGIVSVDPYLANWHAIAAMKVRGPKDSAPLFQRLKDVLRKGDTGFWDDATLVNALIALNLTGEAQERLQAMGLPRRSQDEVESATRFYDEIVSAFGHEFDWRKAAGLSGARETAQT